MAIYLGDSGCIQIKRKGINTGLAGTLGPDDVNTTRNRFSFDFDVNAIITGDRVEIATVDKSTLELVAGHNQPDGAWYVHIDDVGGMRLFEQFEDSINNSDAKALALVKPSKDQQIVARTRDLNFNCVAQVSTYELTTTRETVDISTLGEEFRTNYANGMISGQGSLTCFWEYTNALCDDETSGKEVADYLARLVIRTEQGANFEGRFFVKRPTYNDPETAVWYEAHCIISNVAMTFTPGAPVSSAIQFVTTGPIRLRLGSIPGVLLQEDDGILLQESGDPIDLE